MQLKTETGKLLEAGILRIHFLRSQKWTLAAIAAEVGVTSGTVYNICRGKTHPDLHPSRPLYHELVNRAGVA